MYSLNQCSLQCPRTKLCFPVPTLLMMLVVISLREVSGRDVKRHFLTRGYSAHTPRHTESRPSRAHSITTKEREALSQSQSDPGGAHWEVNK